MTVTGARRAATLLAAAVLVALLPGATRLAEAADAFWLRTWTVAAVAGEGAPPGLVGLKIELGLQRIVDPLAQDCANSVSYDDVQRRPVADLGRHFGAFWRWPALPGPEVVYGWIRCAGTNIGGFAFVDGSLGYRFYEGGLVLTLN